MTEHLGLSPKPAETQIPLPNSSLLSNLEIALATNDVETISKLTAENPREIFCWATLTIAKIASGELNGFSDKVGAYATARIGYHRGLDTLRANGWKGSGFVKADWPGNRGFLSCLSLLSYLAKEIGEVDEEARCAEFLIMLDPSLSANDFDTKSAIEFLYNK